MTQTKWNGKDWREFTCGDCGFIDCDIPFCVKYPEFSRIRDGEMKPACPDFEPRDIPDPEYPDERTNMEHIRTEDRHESD